MGDMLRGHRHPIAGVDEMARISVKPVRLMGEDLVLCRDPGGRLACKVKLKAYPVHFEWMHASFSCKGWRWLTTNATPSGTNF